MVDQNLVQSSDWLGVTRAEGEQVIRMLLLDADVQSAQFALSDYQAAGKQLAEYPGPGVDSVAMARSFHNAKVFVGSMRRVSRLLESLSANRAIFPPDVAEAVRVAWKKHRAFFRVYTEPRNAIEHIDGEIKGKTNWIMVNLANDALEVTPEKAAPVTAAALQVAMDSRNEVVAALREYLPR